MPSAKKTLLVKFLIWKYKHISERQFIYILSVFVGLLTGLGTVLLKNLTHLIQSLLEWEYIKDYHHTLYFIFPTIGLVLVYFVIKYVVRHEIPHGIPSTLYSISKKNGFIERYKMWGSLLTAPLTVGFGGSVGLEGPSVSTGAAFGSNLAQLFHMSTKTRMLLIGCTAAGALAAMFKAPIAAIVFAMEIFSLEIGFASMVPLLIASVSSVLTTYFFRGTALLFSFELQDKFEISDIGFYILLGLFTGIASVYFSKIFFGISNFFEKMTNPFKKLLIGGVGIGAMLFFIPALYGEGYHLMNNLLHGNAKEALGNIPYWGHLTDHAWGIIAMLFIITIFKAIAMTTTFAAGGIGGIFIPTLFMGSALGNMVARIINNLGLGFHVSESNFTLIGMTGLMSGVLHAPLTAIFLIAEITGGYELFVPLMLVAVISYSVTRYFVSHSIYTMELAKRGELMTHNKDTNVLMLLKIDKVIETNFISIKPEMLLQDMLHSAVAKSSRNNFPVVSDDNEFLGVLLLDDIRGIMFDTKLCKKVKVADLMHSAPDLIHYEDDSMQVIMDKFKHTGAWNLPVIKEGKYLGFISKSKLLTAYRRQLLAVTT
ncbi:MAG: chloride channel protein [Flavobacteriaceae bacterium]|nr:chloride channel protein [Flavobacteriaceae bacterium]